MTGAKGKSYAKFKDDLEAPYYKIRQDMPYLPVSGWQHMPMRVAMFDQICPNGTL